MKRVVLCLFLLANLSWSAWAHRNPYEDQPLSKINILKTELALHEAASIDVRPFDLEGQDNQSNLSTLEEVKWVTVTLTNKQPATDDWVAVFSPGKFDPSTCPPNGPEDKKLEKPYICTAPIKFQYANYSTKDYMKTGTATLKFRLVNMRADFAFALFSGGFSNPKLVAISNPVSVFANPKAPLFPRLALGKAWDEMTVTWTSGYNIDEAVPFVEWGLKGETPVRSPAGTLTYDRSSMCGAPARTVGWRHPGFIHTSFLKNLWPNSE